MHNNYYTELLAINYSLLSTNLLNIYLLLEGLEWKYK